MSARYKGRTLDGDAIAVTVDGDTISSVEPTAAGDLPLIAPPLVDLQHNGSLGASYNRLHESPDALPGIAAHARRHGVGRLLATFTTYDFDRQCDSLAVFDAKLKADPDLARVYCGVFFEGIYMSPDYGWRGAHQARWMRDPSWDEWAALQRASGDRIRVFNVDPARPQAIDTIRAAVASGLRVAMGHCGPDAQTIRAAVDAGADLVTHFGNGAPPEVHRHHNPFWTWLALKALKLGVIADGHHLPGDLLDTVMAAKGRANVYLVSDATSAAGLPPGEYGPDDHRFVIEEDGRTHLKDQEILHGAWHQLDRGVERLCELGWSLEDAWRQASDVPARIMGVETPVIAAGQPAEFVLSRYADDGLQLEQVVSMGRRLLDGPVHPRMV